MAKTKPNNDRVDLGTPERAMRQGGVVTNVRVITDGGMEIHKGTAAKHECVLDALLGDKPGEGPLAGTQGSKSDREAVARSRWEAGMRLRRLFVDAGLVGVHASDPNVRGGGGDEMSDAQANARRRYNVVLRRLQGYAEIAAGPCCYDVMCSNDRWLSNVRTALDHLCMEMGL